MLSSSAPLPAKIFGFSGLAPFLILALSAWIFPDPYRLLVFDILVHYAAVILSFVGAVYWGLALCNFNNRSKSEKQMWIMFGWSIIPAVMAWIATQMVLSAALDTFSADGVVARLTRSRALVDRRGEELCRGR